MKNYIYLFFLLCIFIYNTDIYAQNKQEHRSVWVTGYLSDWPSEVITESNVEKIKKHGTNMLDSLQKNNFTTIYFHVRSMCDAMYDSKYEPWAKNLTGTRGKKPLIDPLAFMVDEGHKRGIEVYAWVNPYRYSPNSTSLWGETNLDYVNTNPDWLMKSSGETVLNPGIPEVTTRIVDVCRDIITKYDVDGILYDDYFYPQGGTKPEMDAIEYKKYTDAGGELKVEDWRRANVNNMIKEVNRMVKSVKPWIRFGVSPAGAAGKNAADYGLKPTPGNDWQYEKIYSDPLAWLNNHDIDFISPQIYWPIGSSTNPFEKMIEWWEYVSETYNRHLYASQNVSEYYSLSEFVDEINIIRNENKNYTPGVVYFRWNTLLDGAKYVDGKLRRLLNYLKSNSFTTKTYSPPMNWLNSEFPKVPYSVKNNSGKLSWNGANNMRFLVYAYPSSMNKIDFNQQGEYLIGMVYNMEFDIPDLFKDGYDYAVSTLDRYSNESAAIFVNASLGTAPKADLSFPEDGGSIDCLSTLSWTGTAANFVIEVAYDKDMKNIAYRQTTDKKVVKVSDLGDVKKGVKCYWRILSNAVNCESNASEVRAVVFTPFEIVTPEDLLKDVSLTPTISWTEIKGASYEISISTSKNMVNPIYSTKSSECSIIIPEYVLSAATTFYAKVIATHLSGIIETKVIEFRTKDINPALPVIKCPFNDGDVLYNNSKISIMPEQGVLRTRIEISATDNFPIRTKYSNTLSGFKFDNDEMNTVKIGGKGLVNGVTYYLRARFEYNDTNTGSILNTEYVNKKFIYSSESGVNGINADNLPFISGGENPKLIILNLTTDLYVNIFNSSGVLADSYNTKELSGYTEISLENLEKGVYLVNVNCNGTTTTLKLIK